MKAERTHFLYFIPIQHPHHVVERLVSTFLSHLTRHQRREVHLRPISFDAFAVSSPDTSFVVECISNVTFRAVSRQVELGHEEDDLRDGHIDLEVQREVLHPFRKMDRELTGNIIRDDISPPLPAGGLDSG